MRITKVGVAEFRDEIMNRKVRIRAASRREEEVLRDKYKKIIPHLCNTQKSCKFKPH